MNWILTLPFCALLVELVMRLPFGTHLRRLQRSSSRAMHVVSAKAVSDHWKEKAMGAYARQTFLATATVAALLVLVLGLAGILVIGIDQVFGGGGDAGSGGKTQTERRNSAEESRTNMRSLPADNSGKKDPK